ncbi:MAG: hypothetical protein F6K55_42750 [Moorea sp. SIO4A3]|nr:hypothetical protein [Moorena sp. SIO4A3]
MNNIIKAITPVAFSIVALTSLIAPVEAQTRIGSLEDSYINSRSSAQNKWAVIDGEINWLIYQDPNGYKYYVQATFNKGFILMHSVIVELDEGTITFGPRDRQTVKQVEDRGTDISQALWEKGGVAISLVITYSQAMRQVYEGSVRLYSDNMTATLDLDLLRIDLRTDLRTDQY